jgi:hypothetical protein
MDGNVENRREVRFALRLPPDLHVALVGLAHREGRSLNQQIVQLLRADIRRDERRRRRSERTPEEGTDRE